jgi:nitrogen fixation-related uncharacterized protein
MLVVTVFLVILTAGVSLMMGIVIWHVMWGEYKINKQYRDRNKALSKERLDDNNIQ